MERFLDQAEILLGDVVQSRDLSTLIVLHRLRDLSEVLDSLKLYEECRLTCNCALELADALGRRSLAFRHEQAETVAFIAGLTVYRPRARTLFIQAVSICEELVRDNASHSNKITFLNVLGRAGYSGPDDLRVQWLERAVQLMTKELPLTMVHPPTRWYIYYGYGRGLRQLKQNASAVDAFDDAISNGRIMVNIDPAKQYFRLVLALQIMGQTLGDLCKYDDAVVVYKEALEICTTMSAQDPLQSNQLTADTLQYYAMTLVKSNQASEALAVRKQAVSLCRNFAQVKDEFTKRLCDALHNYGDSCFSLGQNAESLLAYQESIDLRLAFAATDLEQDKRLGYSYHDIANSFHALGKCAEANAAASEALERNHGAVLEICDFAPDFKSCFVCQRAMIPDSLSNASAPHPFPPATSSSQPAEHHRSDV